MSKIISLNGTWDLAWTDFTRGENTKRLSRPDAGLDRCIKAAVPGEVHMDLVKAGRIDDPAYGSNCLKARWVEECMWLYRRTFTAPKLRPGERVFLRFASLDSVANVHLNGVLAGSHTNMFHPCVIDVTDKLKPGANILVVEIEAGLYAVSDKPAAGFEGNPNARLHKRHWLRKPQSSFSWDWSQRLLNVGITGDVTLEVHAVARFDQFAAWTDVSVDLHRGTAVGRVFAEGLGTAPVKGTLELTLSGTTLKAAVDVTIKPGLNTFEARIEVDRPDLWWPVNHGKQPLYTLRAKLTAGGKAVADATARVGFRRVRVNQDKHPVSGSNFIIEVNNKPIFCKGGNFVPADLIFARLDRKRYEKVLDRALEANCNMMRVWGGGLYESDDFYDICNAKGLLVWQEFIFACGKYPGYDEKFYMDFKREAAWQVRRLAHNPSLVVWCGNNEMEWGNYNWGYEAGVVYPDHAIFHLTIPRMLKQEDPTRFYQPSSPISPDYAEPNAFDRGDQHPWALGFGDNDFRKYRRMDCRFPNEGGIMGPTALPTVLSCFDKGQARHRSFTWDIHENSIAFHGDQDTMVATWTGKRVPDLTIPEYVYWGGAVQGMGLGEYIRNFRRRMFDTASAIFWMYNDCWPMVRSWTIVDYHLRRTPAFHPVRRAFQPLVVSLMHEDGKVKVYGVNEGTAVEVTIRYGIVRLAGGYPVERSVARFLPANTSTLVAEFDEAEWKRLGESTHLPFAEMRVDGRLTAMDVLFSRLYKEMKWPKARVTVRTAAGMAVFKSDTFAWRVCLDLDGDRPLADNFFDLLPGAEYAIPWNKAWGRPKVLFVGNDGFVKNRKS